MFRVANLRSLPAPSRSASCMYETGLTLCSLDRLCGMVDVYNYIIRVVNILTFIYLLLWHSYACIGIMVQWIFTLIYNNIFSVVYSISVHILDLKL